MKKTPGSKGTLPLENAVMDLLPLQSTAAIIRVTEKWAREVAGTHGISVVLPETVRTQGPRAAAVETRSRPAPSPKGLRFPLQFGARTWGHLVVQTRASLEPGQRRDLKTLAAFAARAMRNAHVYAKLRRRVKGVTALYRVGTTISSAFALDHLLDLILSSLRHVVPYDAAGIYLLEDDGIRLRGVSLRGYRPEQEHAAMAKLGLGVIGWAATQGIDVLVADVTRDEHYVCAREETRTEMVALLRRGSRMVGAFNVESDSARAYGATDLTLLKAFASQAAVAVENAKLYRDAVEKRRLDAELSLARDIQQRLLPASPPRLAGWEMAGLSIPATRIGGDYYDFIDVSPGVVGISIADVAGKGIPAALVMATFRACLLAEIVNEYSIESILSKVNEILHRSTEPSVFVTAIYGALEAERGIFTYCNAGHVRPILVPWSGSPTVLDGGDLLLGSFHGVTYHQRLVEIRPGDVLVLATDGIVEAPGLDDEEFGIERFAQVVHTHRRASAAEIRDHVYAEVVRFSPDGARRDDMTAVVVRRLPS